MVNGYLKLNVLVLYPDNQEDKDALMKQGYRIENNAYFINLLAGDLLLKYSNIKDIRAYYFNMYQNIILNNAKPEEYVYISNKSILSYGKVVDLDSYKLANKEYSVTYNLDKRVYILNMQTTNLLTSQLEEVGKADRYTIKINNFNNSTLKVEYEVQSAKHDYYSEIISKQLLSSMEDGNYISVDKLLIDIINTKNEEIKELKEIVKQLVNKLGTNLAVQGTPILLPTDIADLTSKITQLEQKQSSNFTMNADTITSINESIEGIYNAKQ